MRPVPLVVVAALTVTGACSQDRPYCYQWSEAYSRGDALRTAAAHQQWILAHLPADILNLLKNDKGAISRRRLESLEHLVTINCELHLTLRVTTVLDDLIANYRAGKMNIIEK